MRYPLTALGWIDSAISTAPVWHRAQVHRLARHLGYTVMWQREDSAESLFDQARVADVAAVITPAPAWQQPIHAVHARDG